VQQSARWAALLGVALLVLALPAQAALNGDHDFAATLPYQNGLAESSGNFTLLSGAMDAKLGNEQGPYGFFQAQDARIEGLSRVCFQTTCYTSDTDSLQLEVNSGGSFGLQFPTATSATAHADHVLALLVDFNSNKDLNTFKIGKTLMAPAVAGHLDFAALPAIPRTTGIPVATPNGNAGGFVALDDQTQVTIYDAATVLKVLPAGKQDPVAFQGHPKVPSVQAGLMVLPFESGSTMHLAPASQDAADTGLDLERIAGLGQNLNQASRAGAKADTPDLSIGPLEPLVPRLLNGALLRLPTKGQDGVNPISQFGYVRFASLDATSKDGAVALAGPTPLEVQDGHIVDAAPLVGFAIFEMPWWSYLLWAIGLFLFVARLIVKPTKEHHLDRFRWIGLVCSILLFLLFFFLWDLEMKAVWGISLLSGGAPGASLAVVAGLELVPMFAVLFAVVAPIRLILKNASLLLHQGRFMGLPGAFAYPFGYIFGAPLLLAFLNVYLKMAAGT